MIVCHMTVGPGEANRYLKDVLDRALLWSDLLHVVVDSRAGEEEWDLVSHYAGAYARSQYTWEDNESVFRQDAWDKLGAMGLSSNDSIVCLDADEVIIDHAMVRVAATEYPTLTVHWRFYEMWSPTQYRIDGLWKPYPAGIMFPYREGGKFRDRALACGRQPTYVDTLQSSRVVGEILHFGYAREEDRHMKHDRYMRLDGGKFHNLAHLKSILYPPSLEVWGRGGLIDV